MQPSDHEIRAWLSAIVESSSDAIIGSRLDGTIFSWNPGAEALYGYTAAEAIGRPVGMLIPPDRLDELTHILEALHRGERIPAYETVRMAKGGQLIDVSITASPIIDEGRTVGASAIARSIAERRLYEEKLRRNERRLLAALEEKEALLRQKDLLLKEVNHRVKNGLQMVAGLLSLQSRYTGDAGLARPLDDACRRVLTIARVHERLYQSDEIGVVELAPYLGGMCDDLVRSVGGGARGFAVDVDIPAVSLPADRIVLLGLIVNELVTNAQRHAYADGPGRVEITAQTAGETLVLHVRDRGSGLPGDVEAGRSRGFGMRLVARLADQLRARLEIERGAPGTEVRILVPLDGEAAQAGGPQRERPVPA